ncbi:hypothetical protein BGZ94_004269 [Podila epigama]|nr:hypothetical protein BGZ94_004269 [Podila epigama]
MSASPTVHAQAPQGAARKHGKKKSRTSWKAGFNSTPSSPSQSAVDTRSTAPLSVSANTTTATNSQTLNSHNKQRPSQQQQQQQQQQQNQQKQAQEAHRQDKTTIPLGDPVRVEHELWQSTSKRSEGPQEAANKENIDPSTSSSTAATATAKADTALSVGGGLETGATTTTTTKSPAIHAGSGPKKNEFLQSLDIQLIKLQRDEERALQQNATGGGNGNGSSTKDNKASEGQKTPRITTTTGKKASDVDSSNNKTVQTPLPGSAEGAPKVLMDDLRLKSMLESISPDNAVSLWDYLKEELTAADFETTQELKRERVANFLSVPIAFEKMLVFGYFVCLDSFLYNFTILPARFVLAVVALFRYIFSRTWFSKNSERIRLKSSQKCDLIKVTLVVVACTVLQSVDASRTYHFIRGQNAMKLYAIFNCLEIFDRLCCSFGQDILDSLFSKSTLGSHPPRASLTASRHARPLTFVILAIFYILAHTMVLFFQMVTLNVAVNSYSNALLTLLISNQFVEIKGSVFKKFEKENLFQLSCSDIVERFQLSVFVTIITIRNLVELSAAPPSPFSVYPQSFVPLFSSMTAMARLLTPCFLVLGCETLVDWLKHAFITKFNQIRPSVYGRFVDILSRDLVVGSPARLAGRNKQQQMFVDQSPMVSRRIGLAALPLACLVICVSIQTLQMVLSTMPNTFIHSHANGGGTGEAMAAAAATATAAAAARVHFDPWVLEWPACPVIELEKGFGVGMSVVLEFVVSLSHVLWMVMEQTWREVCRLVLVWACRAGISLAPGLWRRVVEVAVVCLTCVATYACLVALKLLIGINLLGFAHQRYVTMDAREQNERQAERQMRESNGAQEERAAHGVVVGMLAGGDGKQGGDSYGTGGERRTIPGLDTIDRFTLFKSRIP